MATTKNIVTVKHPSTEALVRLCMLGAPIKQTSPGIYAINITKTKLTVEHVINAVVLSR